MFTSQVQFIFGPWSIYGRALAVFPGISDCMRTSIEVSSSMRIRWRIWRRRHYSISQSASSSFVLRLPIGRKLFFEKPFYRAGINDSGIKRISKLAIQRDLPLNFVIALNNVYRLPFHDDSIDQENLKNKISDLLTDVEISNECIGTVR